MNKVHRVVVCTDFAAGSAAAVERGLQIARSHQAQLDLLHAFDTGILTRLGAAFDPRRLGGQVPPDVELRKRVTAVAHGLAERSGVDVQPCFGAGEPAAVLEAHVRAHHPAVAVLARRADPDAPGVGGSLMRVLRGVSCPILVVRSRADGPGATPDYRRVLSAVDLREVSGRAAAAAIGLFPRADHRLLTVVDPRWERALWPQGESTAGASNGSLRDEAERRLGDMASRLPFDRAARPAVDVLEGSPSRVLIDQAAAWSADCIAVGRHGQGLLAERWLGSTTLDLIHHGGRDVLVVS